MTITCPNCGKQIPEHSKFCPYCGERLPTEDLRRQQVSLRFTPPSVPVTPGGSAELALMVANVGTLVEQVHALVEPPTDAWATVEPKTLRVMPGDRLQALLVLHPPQNADVAAGDHQVVVTLARDEHGGTPLARAAGIVHVQAVRQLTMRIVPSRDAGRRNSARQVELANTGNAQLTINLAATDPDDALVFGVPPGPIELPMRGELSRRIDVRARRPRLRGRALEREFSVKATWQDGGTVSATATFVQKSWRFVNAVLLLMLLLAAGLAVIVEAA